METILNKKVLVSFATVVLLLSAVAVATPLAVACKGGVPAPGANHNVEKLIPADPSWGVYYIGDLSPSGYVKYLKESDGFEGRIQISGLLPDREYMLCLNGKPGYPPEDPIVEFSNDQLKEHGWSLGIAFLDDWVEPAKKTTPGGTWGNEGFTDFMQITTDGKGKYVGAFHFVGLPSGDYHVKLFVKDAHAWWIHQETGSWNTIALQGWTIQFTIT